MMLQYRLPLPRANASGKPRPLSIAAAAAVATAPAKIAVPSLERFTSKNEMDKRYTIVELLGQGTYATVYTAQDRVSGEDVAVKALPKYKHLKNRLTEILAEIDIRRQLRGCRNVVELHGIYEDSDTLYFVEELCSGGDVQMLLASEGTLSEPEAAKILQGVLVFLADSHAHNISIGDIKPANFAIKNLFPSILHIMDPSNPRGKLDIRAIDFGCCQRYDDQCLMPRFTGTPVYMAPEMLRGCPGLPVDVWSAGVVLYELLSGKFPFWDCEPLALDHMTHAQLRDGIVSGPIMFDGPLWRGVSPGARDLIERMLDRDVASRITAAEALQHPWLVQAASTHLS